MSPCHFATLLLCYFFLTTLVTACTFFVGVPAGLCVGFSSSKRDGCPAERASLLVIPALIGTVVLLGSFALAGGSSVVFAGDEDGGGCRF